MEQFLDSIVSFFNQSGFAAMTDWRTIIMLLISFVLLFLAIVKKFEPLLLLPIAFGMLLTNLPMAELYHPELFAGGHVHWDMFGGATVINSADISKEILSMLGTNSMSVLESGEVTLGGALLGHVTDFNISGSGYYLNEVGALIDAAGKIVADNVSISVDLAGSYISNGALYVSGINDIPLASAATTVSAGLLDYLY